MAAYRADYKTQWALFPEVYWLNARYASAPADVFHANERGVTFGREGQRCTTYLWEVVPVS